MIAKGREIQPGGHAVDAAEFASLMAPLGPFGDRPAIAVAVSGGPHSLALALLARDWVAARGGALRALVVDHGLRADSDEEAGAVAAMLASQGIAADILMLGLPTGRRVRGSRPFWRLAPLPGGPGSCSAIIVATRRRRCCSAPRAAAATSAWQRWRRSGWRPVP